MMKREPMVDLPAPRRPIGTMRERHARASTLTELFQEPQATIAKTGWRFRASPVKR